MKKVIVLGGGTGLSTLLRGLKQFPVDITAVVSVSDDGRSTGKLRKEFNIPAVGDIRQVIIALSETEPLFQNLLNYRFKTNSDLSGHALGNLLLTGLIDVAGNMSDGIESLSKVLNLKGKVLPLTEDNVVLMAEMIDGSIVEGEHNITEKNQKIKKIFYKETPKVLDEVICEIKRADLILLSMGSLFTSLLPNLICDEVKNAIDSSKGDVMYVCNMMTQPGETDNFKVSDHINVINSYLNKKKISYVIVNDGEITQKIKNKYLTEEQKDPVIYDKENLNNINVISDNFVKIENDLLRHNTAKLGFHIYSYFLKDE
ncbi:MAG TPA: YvcK family protein [Candidatus Faecisoma merdavium]|nr:YvcK family protein [Candidatus Faecisoma merdavium]